MAKYASDRLIGEVAAEAAIELSSCLYTGRKERMKNLAKRILGRGGEKKDPLFWPAGLLLLGLLESGQEEEAGAYLDRCLETGAAPVHTDDALCGYAALRLYEKTRKKEYKELADAVFSFLQEARKDKEGSIVYNAARNNSYVFADGCGQASMFLSRYAKITGHQEARDLAQIQLANFQEHGFDRNTGLPYHGYDAQTGIKYGIIGWGRAVGWLLFGMSEYMLCFPDDETQGRHLRELCAAVMRYQRKDHLFSWQLECIDGPSDTSAAGMILYSIARAQDAGICEVSEGSLADAATALSHEINGGRVYGASAECLDFSEYRQVYGNFPWGQGAVLAYLSRKGAGADDDHSESDGGTGEPDAAVRNVQEAPASGENGKA